VKNILTIIIGPRGSTIVHPHDPAISEVVDESEQLGQRLVEFCGRHGVKTARAVLYLSEELIYYKEALLPLKSSDLRKTIAYQLEMLTPFKKEEVLYSFTSRRHKENYKVSLVVTRRGPAEKAAQDILAAGYKLIGLYPESQRYVGRASQKTKWALVLPGNFPKVLSFSGTHLEDRFLCSTEPAFDDLTSLCGTQTIYHVEPPSGSSFKPAQPLISELPALKEFNLLPATYRLPDYTRIAIIALLVLNMIAVLGLIGVKEFSLLRTNRLVEMELDKIMPQVQEAEKLREQERKVTEEIKQLNTVGKNPEIIPVLEKLAEILPKKSYLDQLRMDGKSRSLLLQGYTDDVSELTTKLQELGQATLKSTSRRQNKTYFQVEVTLT